VKSITSSERPEAVNYQTAETTNDDRVASRWYQLVSRLTVTHVSVAVAVDDWRSAPVDAAAAAAAAAAHCTCTQCTIHAVKSPELAVTLYT